MIPSIAQSRPAPTLSASPWPSNHATRRPAPPRPFVATAGLLVTFAGLSSGPVGRAGHTAPPPSPTRLDGAGKDPIVKPPLPAPASDALTLAHGLVALVDAVRPRGPTRSLPERRAEAFVDELRRTLAGDAGAASALERRHVQAGAPPALAEVLRLRQSVEGDPYAMAALEARLAAPGPGVPTLPPPYGELAPIATRLVLALHAGAADEQTAADTTTEVLDALTRSFERRGSPGALAHFEAGAVLERVIGRAPNAIATEHPKGAA